MFYVPYQTNKYFQFHSYKRLLRMPDPATEALNTSGDSWLCEANIENNPLCGSFLPRFTGLSESWITGNHFQSCISTKNSSTTPWTIFRRMRKSLSGVCTQQLWHILWHSMCKSWSDLNVCTILRAKLGSASLDREVGDCTRGGS